MTSVAAPCSSALRPGLFAGGILGVARPGDRRTGSRARACPLARAVAWAPVIRSVGIVAVAVSMWSDVSPVLLVLSPVGILAG